MDVEPIRLLQLEAVLDDLQVKTEYSAGNPLSFDVYRFSFGERRLAFYSLRGHGRVAPFLAVGDRVEVVAHWPQQAQDEEGLVYGLRNLEDGRVYFAHGIFRIRFAARAMTVFTARRLKEMARMLGVLALATLLLIGAIIVFAGPEPEWDMLLLCAIFFANGFAVIALSSAIARARWRAGYATGRQRLTERVYAACGLQPPLISRLPPRVYEV
ncbi:hypothetical protein [Lysobacter sp. CA199]|uniref:hypothetical protein n=1 Tax=Lysobacter sp. CA199 TaxID=3455608 RepID=UPI003F8D53C1